MLHFFVIFVSAQIREFLIDILEFDFRDYYMVNIQFLFADSNIYFLTLPENLDPDNYINQKGKDSFIKLAKNKIDIKCV